MANDITGNPLVLDTASTSTVVDSRRLRITGVTLDSGASGVAGDQVMLKDKNSKIKVQFAVDVAKGSRHVPFNPPVFSDGLIAHTIARGHVLVYLEQ
jgi:hypothetical protein